MNRRTITTVITLGAVSLISIMIVQVLWIQKTGDMQATNIELQEREDSLNIVNFNKQTTISLHNVLEVISSHLKDSSDLYGSVKQIDHNYFSVQISEEIIPLHLENLLKRQLYAQQVHQDFRYGIYDCFTEDFVFGELIKFDTIFKAISDPVSERKHKKLMGASNNHYFTVFFPNIETTSFASNIDEVYSPYYYLIIIVVVVLIFFLFAVSVIIRQKRLSEVKTDFINNMTHELKTPISTIGLSAEMIMRTDFTDDDEKLKKYAGIIFKENKRLEHQVERVLKVAKLEKDKISLSKEKFDVHELLEEAKDNFLFNQNESGGTIELVMKASEECIQADPVHISNVVYNLIDNAIKYCKKTPEITIRTNADKKWFYLEVEDNAIGMKREDIKMIFDKFYRVPTGNLHDVKGFGLGLHYVKLIIEEHEGTINVKSTLGKGSVFLIRLPVN
jgi:two-component system phosphate regulon sensor histidine kinase PhoR